MKVAIYVRVSRVDLNLSNQTMALEDYCKQRGWEYQLFEEKESTRKTRPVKEEVLNLARQRKFDAILVYKIDRWARSLQELIMNIEELKSRGIGFMAMAQPIDTTANSGSSGMMMVQLLGVFAEFEREMIRERTMAGLDRARAQGKTLGRPRKKEVIQQGGFSYRLEQKP